MQEKQSSVFLSSEADEWYKRNKAALTAKTTDRILDVIERREIQPKRVLEIGCANGWRLQRLQIKYNCECYGIEPSMAAVKEGSSFFPELHLSQGTADKLPYADGAFDLVVFGFCLYLCDPADLFAIAKEAHRVLSNGGNLAILDFYSPYFYRNAYTHKPGLYSHKMNYASMMSWHPSYSLVSQEVFGHDPGSAISTDPQDWVAVSLLHKAGLSRL